MYAHTAKRRDVLENQEIFIFGKDFAPEGNFLVLEGCISPYLPPLVLLLIQYAMNAVRIAVYILCI